LRLNPYENWQKIDENKKLQIFFIFIYAPTFAAMTSLPQKPLESFKTTVVFLSF
jgi:hypothetical protein